MSSLHSVTLSKAPVTDEALEQLDGGKRYFLDRVRAHQPFLIINTGSIYEVTLGTFDQPPFVVDNALGCLELRALKYRQGRIDSDNPGKEFRPVREGKGVVLFDGSYGVDAEDLMLLDKVWFLFCGADNVREGLQQFSLPATYDLLCKDYR